MRDLYDKAAQVATDVWEFAKEHSAFVAVVVLGVLILAPQAVEVLGFGKLGPIECMLCRSLPGYVKWGSYVILMRFIACRNFR